MIRIAIPPFGPLEGKIAAPASKSFTNRALVLAALAGHPVRIARPLDCGDADSMISALSAAGVGVRRVGEDLVVSPGAPPAGEATLDVRESGTACRFLAAFAAATPGLSAVLTGSPRLCERPIEPLVDALRTLGADVGYGGADGYPPLRIRGRELRGGAVEVDGSRSSQYASALLLAAPRFRDGLRLSVIGRAVSRAYLATTREALAAAGIAVAGNDRDASVAPGARVVAEELAVPGDYSSGVSIAAAVAAAGGTVRIDRLPSPSSQADARAFDVLGAMGTGVERTGGAITVSGRAVRPSTADAADFPDAVAVLCAAAARVDGESVFSGVDHLRLKESDRIAAILDLLEADGVPARYADGELRIAGGARRFTAPPVYPTRADHRIVMAGTILALERGGLVESPRAVAKSYPGFFRDLFAL